MPHLQSGPNVASVSAKELEAVKSLFVQHPYFVEAYRRVRQALLLPGGYGILLVVGPPGVGKSALALACRMRQLEKSFSLNLTGMKTSSGAIPIISVAARAGISFPSRWKALLLDILKVTNPPLAEAGNAPSEGRPVLSMGRGFETFSIPRLESAVIESLRYRSTVGLLVDEGQDLAPFDSVTDSIQMAKSLKHLGSAAQTVLIMFGSYSLLNFLDLEAQLSRRCVVVHFPRYDIARPADHTNFQRVLATFCSAAPTLLPYAKISQEFPLIYTGSAGGTGNLRMWLVRAMGHAILAGANQITAAHLRAEVMSDATIRQLIGAAQSGEELFGKLCSSLDATVASIFAGIPLTSSAPRSNSATFRRHPGKRHPQRDPVNMAD